MTKSTKDWIFINAVGWIIVNLFLVKKHFVYGKSEVPETDKSETASEFQEKVAMALIKNQRLTEAPIRPTPDGNTINNLESCVKHPKHKPNLCKFCYQRRTVYICNVCSNPGRSKVRKERSSKGNVKMTDPGFNHYCKGGCFTQHTSAGPLHTVGLEAACLKRMVSALSFYFLNIQKKVRFEAQKPLEKRP